MTVQRVLVCLLSAPVSLDREERKVMRSARLSYWAFSALLLTLPVTGCSRTASDQKSAIGSTSTSTSTSVSGLVCPSEPSSGSVGTVVAIFTGTVSDVVTGTATTSQTAVVSGVVNGTVTASATVSFVQTMTKSEIVTSTRTFTATMTAIMPTSTQTYADTGTTPGLSDPAQTSPDMGTTPSTRTNTGTGTAGAASTQPGAGAGSTPSSTSSNIGTGTAGTTTTQPGAGTGTASSTSTGTAATGVSDGGEATFTDGTYPLGSGQVLLDTTPNTWRTALDPTSKRYVFVSPDGNQTVLQGISMTGLETGTRETKSGAGFWLYLSGQGNETTNAPKVLTTVVDTLVQNWKTDVVRIPICGSAWTQDYVVQDWGGAKVSDYKSWVDLAVQRVRSQGKVAILDMHLWAIAKMSKGSTVQRGTFVSNGQTRNYSDYEDGCTGMNKVNGIDSCAPKDWYTDDANTWECAIANADGATLHSAYYNKDSINAMWTDIATRYKADSGVWFELYNEPYSRKAVAPFPSFGANEMEKDYAWDLWSQMMGQWIASIRDTAQAKNIIVVNGLDWAYSFGPQYGPLAYPDKYLTWKTKYANIAYGFHPYQHGACCGQIGAGDTDLSATDPYESGYCAYYPDNSVYGKPSGAALPGGASCIQNGYAASQDKKMPPCHWVATAYNPVTKQNGLCGGDRSVCAKLDQTTCSAMNWNSPKAGGWSTYVLPMNQFGPLIATEFGSFDCSSAFVNTLLKYAAENQISYTAWALWPQDSGGPGGLGACGYPSVMTPVPGQTGDFRQCFDVNGCMSLVQPLRWAGKLIYADLQSR